MPEDESYAFFGRIHPERTATGIDNTVQMQHRSDFGDVDIEFFIHGSHVLANATPHGEFEDLATLRNSVQSSVSSLTDQFAFLFGAHIDVEIFSVIAPDGYKAVFGVEYDYIKEKLSSEDVWNDWLPKTLAVYRTEASPYLQRSFTDFKLAMHHPEDTGFYCFRAVESLRQFFNSNDDADSWEALRDAVNVSQETIEDDIKQYADARRHGDVLTISGDERQLVLETTWDILKEFIEYSNNELDEIGEINEIDQAGS